MQKSKKSKSCGCFRILFKSQKKKNAEEYSSNKRKSPIQPPTNNLQNSSSHPSDLPADRKIKTDTNFYQPQKHIPNEKNYPLYQTYYKSTIVSNHSYGNTSFQRAQSIPASNKPPSLNYESRPDSQDLNLQVNTWKQSIPPFHDISGIGFNNFQQISPRPYSQNSVPNLFDTQKLKKKPLGSLPPLVPAMPWRFKRNNGLPSARENNKFDNILEDLKKEIEEEPRVLID
ncbi:unnamed protein product [Blepharisma stoltei]|uniref:Uncharacterized protein n=1 Tax=Blepharisma stoltei TaxID=1481888 RepID=A0AAU9IR02_9CILI|nr:unnamed protein product [Blepharisma stoltei]